MVLRRKGHLSFFVEPDCAAWVGCLSDVTKVKEFKIRFLAFATVLKKNLSNQLNTLIDQTLFPYYENRLLIAKLIFLEFLPAPMGWVHFLFF